MCFARYDLGEGILVEVCKGSRTVQSVSDEPNSGVGSVQAARCSKCSLVLPPSEMPDWSGNIEEVQGFGIDTTNLTLT